MKKLNFVAFLLAMMLIPFASADSALFEKELGENILDNFYDENNITFDIVINSIDLVSEKCNVGINGEFVWINKESTSYIGNFEVEVEEIDNSRCEIKVKPKSNGLVPDVFLESIDVNVRSDEYGHHFINNGDVIKYTIKISSNKDIQDVPYVLYNNGYPTGEDSTKEVSGFVNIGVGITELEIDMSFKYNEDIIYSSGAFMTSFVFDEHKEKLSRSYAYVIPIYVIDKDFGGCYYYRYGGREPEGGICQITQEEKDYSLDAELCVGDKEIFDIGGNKYEVVFSNNVVANGLWKVNGEPTSSNIPGSSHNDFYIDVQSSNNGCAKINFGCRGNTCVFEEIGNVEKEEPFTDKHYMISKGETMKHRVNGVMHVVSLLIIENTSPASAVFEINEEVTKQIKEDGTSDKNKELILKLNKIYIEEESVMYQLSIGNSLQIKVKEEQKISCDNGCYVNHDTNKCFPFGTRLEYEGNASYCDITGELKSQGEDGSEANNNYECKSNSARYGVCENIKEQQSAMKKVFEWLSKLFGGN